MKYFIHEKILLMYFLLLTGCFAKVPNYYEPWQRDYYQQFDDIRVRVAAHGLLSANSHNTQPWIIKLDQENTNKFELYVDPERLLPETDPPSRQITISQGTFLETSKIAAEEFGYDFSLELFPNGEYGETNFNLEMKDHPVARVTLTKNEESQKPELYDEIFQRVTNRTAYYGNPLKEEEITILTESNDNSNLSLVFFSDRESLEKICSLTISGVKVEATTEPKVRETEGYFRDSEKEKKEYRDGITLMSGGLRGFKLQFVQFFANLFPLSWEKIGQYWIKSETRNIHSAPSFAMIISNDNSRTTQVEVGILFTRFQLKASQMGICMQPLSQVLQEFPEMAELYEQVHREFAENDQTIQMLVRMGRAVDVLHSPRRDVMELIR